MTQTWLDWYASKVYADAAEDVAAACRDMVREGRVPANLEGTDEEAVRVIARSHKTPPIDAVIRLHQVSFRADRHADHVQLVNTGRQVKVTNEAMALVDGLHGSILSIAASRYRGTMALNGLPIAIEDVAPALTRPRSLKLDAGLVSDLIGVEAPRSEAVEQALREHLWHFDLPQGSVMVGTDLQVRALFISPLRGLVQCYAVLTRPGSNAIAGGMMWHSNSPDADPHAPVVLGDLLSDVGVSEKPLPELDVAKATAELNAFIRLVIMYREVCSNVIAKPLPHQTADLPARDRNWRNKIKRGDCSLFRIESLERPADRFGEAAAERGDRAGWRLGWRTEVKGHMKLQPHGPGSMLRKLIYVVPYTRGPMDAPT